MSAEQPTRPFTITSDSAFTEEGVWLIDIHLRFTRSSEPKSVILDKARPALTDAILQEALRGRCLGATSMRVHLETDRHVTDFVLPERFLRSQALE